MIDTDPDTWIDALSTIYADLLQRQEPLGADFDKAWSHRRRKAV